MARTKDKGGGSASCTFDGVYQTPSGNVSGTTCQEWVDLHFPSQPPVASIRAVPSFGLYEVGFDIVNPQIEGRGALGSNPAGSLTLLELFRGGTGGVNLAPDEVNPTPGTWYPRTDTFTVSSNQTYTARITDDQTRSDTGTGGYTFVLPYYATTVDITTLTKQSLQTSSTFTVDMVAESGSDKQKFDLVDTFTVTGVEVWNTLSSTWEWLGGSPANSLTLFDVSIVTHTVQGNVLNYTRFEHNSVLTGARQLRFHA